MEFSIAEVAYIFGERPGTMRSWVEDGLLNRPIRVQELQNLIVNHPRKVDLSKVNQFFFLHLVRGTWGE